MCKVAVDQVLDRLTGYGALQVSTQLQSTVDQVKTLKASLAETTKALEKTDANVKKQESELQQNRSDAKTLQAKVRSCCPVKFTRLQACR